MSTLTSWKLVRKNPARAFLTGLTCAHTAWIHQQNVLRETLAGVDKTAMRAQFGFFPREGPCSLRTDLWADDWINYYCVQGPL